MNFDVSLFRLAHILQKVYAMGGGVRGLGDQISGPMSGYIVSIDVPNAKIS